MGAALGLTLALFAVDMMCRIIPAIENLKYITPFYYANAADIFTDSFHLSCVIIGAIIILLCYCGTHIFYHRKDLAI